MKKELKKGKGTNYCRSGERGRERKEGEGRKGKGVEKGENKARGGWRGNEKGDGGGKKDGEERESVQSKGKEMNKEKGR